MNKKLLFLLVLLLTATTGAMAQSAFTAKEISSASQLTSTDDGAYVAACMPSDFLAVDAEVAKKWGGAPDDLAMLIYAIEGNKIKMARFLKGSNNATFGETWSIATFKDQLPNGRFFYTAPPTYSVTLAEGTEDEGNWSVPKEAAEGAKVTVTYSGEKKVKSVKAVKKAAAMTDLATITADYEAKDGETLTGTLASNVKISIADGANVTLKDATINGVDNDSYEWAGITCAGDATITLEGTNTVKGFYADYPGIQVPMDKTLTIQGTGSLNASSNGYGAGIGGGYEISCGNIVINSGNITATGGNGAAGIGGGEGAGCGNITINGGTVTATGGQYGAGIGSGGEGENYGSCGNITISGGTVEATGGENAAGIGGGRYNGACGTITITSGVTSVKATKGTNAPNSIGKGDNGQDITVNIENGAKVIMTPVTVTWNNLNFNSNPYTRDGVTLTTTGNAASANNFNNGGDKTFTNTLGKFTKIEIVCESNNFNGWAKEQTGGYQVPEGPYVEVFKLTWTGNAESVTIPGGNYLYGISSITFNIQ